MSERKRGGWSNPASAANGAKGGRIRTRYTLSRPAAIYVRALAQSRNNRTNVTDVEMDAMLDDVIAFYAEQHKETTMTNTTAIVNADHYAYGTGPETGEPYLQRGQRVEVVGPEQDTHTFVRDDSGEIWRVSLDALATPREQIVSDVRAAIEAARAAGLVESAGTRGYRNAGGGRSYEQAYRIDGYEDLDWAARFCASQGYTGDYAAFWTEAAVIEAFNPVDA